MSRYKQRPMELSALRTVSLFARGGKVRTEHFARPYEKGAGITAWLSGLPRLLAADGLRAVARRILEARQRDKPVIFGFGGHVIKCGLAPVLIDLMQRGLITAFATNGSGAIHDFEIALAGYTSEDVEAVLPDGSFGAAEETGREMNLAIAAGNAAGIGIGEALGQYLHRNASEEFAPASLFVSAWRAQAPVTVHVALGTDTPHLHPSLDPAALGSATHRDFLLLCSLVAEMDEGGVFINAGSAVVLPEVFLKVVSAVRNLGHPLRNFTTVNMDFLPHYRPRMNVVERPHAGAGGQGYSLTGHHEIMIPLLAAILVESQS